MEKYIQWNLFEEYKEKKEKGEDAPTLKDLNKDWNDHVLPKIKEAHLNPLLEEMERSRYAYFKCMKEYDSIVGHYRGHFEDLMRQEGPRMRGSFPPNELMNSRHFNKLPLITNDHLRYFERQREIPESIREKFEAEESGESTEPKESSDLESSR